MPRVDQLNASPHQRPVTWRLVAACLVIATAFAIVEHLQGIMSGSRDMPFLVGLLRMERPWLLLGALAPFVVWTATRFPLDKGRWQRSLPIHLVGSFAFAYGHLALLAWSARFFFDNHSPVGTFTLELARFYLIQNLFAFWTLVAATHAWWLYHSLQRRDVDAAHLRSMLSEARLDALRHQIQPHFLFNTLNTVSMLARSGDCQAVVKVVADLSGLLRYSLRDAGSDDVSLREEIAFVEQYIGIESIRFGGRLRVRYDVEPGTESALLPSLILQPLVENAVRHGLARIAAQAELHIKCARDEGRLVLEIEDNGDGVPQAWDRNGADGIGLRNIADRLDALYGASASLEVQPRESRGTVARVAIPFRLAPQATFVAV